MSRRETKLSSAMDSAFLVPWREPLNQHNQGVSGRAVQDPRMGAEPRARISGCSGCVTALSGLEWGPSSGACTMSLTYPPPIAELQLDSTAALALCFRTHGRSLVPTRSSVVLPA